MVPRIIHQSYKTVEHPYPRHWQQSWRDSHTGWDYRFHTDDDNLDLVRTHFSRFLAAFEAFPCGIMRADFARFLYLYLWGGVYADLDYVCLNPFDALLEQIPQLGIPMLSENTYYRYHNALLISEAGNPFWLKCAQHAEHYFLTEGPPESRIPRRAIPPADRHRNGKTLFRRLDRSSSYAFRLDFVCFLGQAR